MHLFFRARKRIFRGNFKELFTWAFNALAADVFVSRFRLDECYDFIRECDFRSELLFFFGRGILCRDIGETTRENAL